MINKRMFSKANDKKILHKVGKQWKVISVALLMAIGGVAATGINSHAQANSNNVEPAVESEVKRLETKPRVVTPQTNASASTASTSASASAKAPSKASFNYAPSAQFMGHNASAASYHNNDNFDKANVKFYGPIVKSYVTSVNARYPQARSLVAKYNNFSGSVLNDRSMANSYMATAKNQNTSNIISAKASAAKQTPSFYVGSVANAVLGPTGYMANIRNDASLADQEAKVASGATLISEINGNPLLSDEYRDRWVLANASANVDKYYASDESMIADDDVQVSNLNESNLFSAENRSNLLSLNDNIAKINSALDASTVDSIASSAGFGPNSSVISSAVNVLAHHFNGNEIPDENYWVEPGYSNNGTEVMSTANDNLQISANGQAGTPKEAIIGINVPASELAKIVSDDANQPAKANAYTSASNALALYRVVSDTAAQDQYANQYSGIMNQINQDKSAVSTNASNVSSAKSTLVNANAKASASVSVASADEYLANDPSLAGIFGTNKTVARYANDLITVAQKAENANLNGSLSGNAIDGNSRKAQLDRVIAAGIQSLSNDSTAVELKADLNNVNNWLNDLKTVMANTKRGANNNHVNVWYDPGHGNNAKEVAFQKAVVNAFYGYYGDHDAFDDVPLVNSHTMFHGYYMDHVATAIDDALNEVSLISHGGLFNPKDYAAASAVLTNGFDLQNPNESLAVSNVASAANAEESEYNHERSASASYSNATDQSVTIASQFADYYNSLASNAYPLTTNAKRTLDDYYQTHVGDPVTYDHDRLVYQTAASDEPNDSALATAFGVNVMNYSPHYITLIKNAMLHSNPAFTKQNAVTSVKAGESFTVEGVGFDQDGNIRYVVSANNGKRYYLTGNDQYVKNTYLEPGQSYHVKFVKDARVHSNVDFGKGKVTGYVKAGTTINGLSVRADDLYEGITRLQLPNGNYVTANNSFIKVLNTKQPSNNAASNSSANDQVVNFWA